MYSVDVLILLFHEIYSPCLYFRKKSQIMYYLAIYLTHNLYCRVEQPSLVILVLTSVFANFTLEKMQTKVIAYEMINDNTEALVRFESEPWFLPILSKYFNSVAHNNCYHRKP